jgi:hypothetical protein
VRLCALCTASCFLLYNAATDGGSLKATVVNSESESEKCKQTKHPSMDGPPPMAGKGKERHLERSLTQQIAVAPLHGRRCVFTGDHHRQIFLSGRHSSSFPFPPPNRSIWRPKQCKRPMQVRKAASPPTPLPLMLALSLRRRVACAITVLGGGGTSLSVSKVLSNTSNMCELQMLAKSCRKRWIRVRFKSHRSCAFLLTVSSASC